MPRNSLTTAERDRLKERLKTLIYAGHSVRVASEMCGIEETTAQKWATRGGWRKEIQQVKQLVSMSEGVPSATTILFDRAVTAKETRNSLSRSALKVAKEIETMNPSEIYATASQFKATVESSAKLAGDWEQDQGNRFAVSLNLNQVVASGQIREVPLGTEIIEV